MFQSLHRRLGHYLLLSALSAALLLPNLGVPSLWDIDEGNNAEAGREMYASGNWRIPTFNSQLRVDKPVLLYWLQIFAYQAVGVNEWGARLPSALAGLVAVLLTYELGRLMFGAGAGLVAGVVLCGTVLFCAAAHFANPDALLAACTVLTFLCFWRGLVQEDRIHFVPTASAMALAVLAKGPVGLVLPMAVMFLFLMSSRRLHLLWDRRFCAGLLVFLVIALPWYIWVGVETKAIFLREFLFKHNLGRFTGAMENHGGPFYYYAVVLILGFSPWSVFLVPSFWYSRRDDGETPEGSAPSCRTSVPQAAAPQRASWRFLFCWVAVYFLFFSISHTKLPNYILPIYPAVAILTGRFLMGWQRGAIQPPLWMMILSFAGFALIGAGTVVGFFVAGGVIESPLMRGRYFPGLESGAVLGAVPILGAVVAGWCLRRQYRLAALLSIATASVLFIGPLAAWGGGGVDAYKAPRSLARAILDHQSEREIRIACCDYFQPSLVFYCRRNVLVLGLSEKQVDDFLQTPFQVFLILPARKWEELRGNVPTQARMLGRHHDLYRGCDVVLVTNR